MTPDSWWQQQTGTESKEGWSPFDLPYNLLHWFVGLFERECGHKGCTRVKGHTGVHMKSNGQIILPEEQCHV